MDSIAASPLSGADVDIRTLEAFLQHEADLLDRSRFEDWMALFTPDGYYRTGDVVRLTPTGNYSVEGRVKDMINRGGEKISAEEVENLALGHPAVQNVAAVAMPDPVLGEKVCAFVVPRPGKTLTLRELRDFMDQAGISRFKLPERLELVESFPLTTVGKISKKDLREDIAARLRAEGKPN